MFLPDKIWEQKSCIKWYCWFKIRCVCREGALVARAPFPFWNKVPLRNVKKTKESPAQICRQKECTFRSDTTKLKQKSKEKEEKSKRKGIKRKKEIGLQFVGNRNYRVDFFSRLFTIIVVLEINKQVSNRCFYICFHRLSPFGGGYSLILAIQVYSGMGYSNHRKLV